MSLTESNAFLEALSLSEKEQMESRLYVFPAKSYVQEDRWDFFFLLYLNKTNKKSNEACQKEKR